jgi:hypothetical protein
MPPKVLSAVVILEADAESNHRGAFSAIDPSTVAGYDFCWNQPELGPGRQPASHREICN